jgi:RNA polymerase sigma-70 factor (ECF subfamily)
MQNRVDEFAALMAGVREGSQEAARELYQRYGRHILRVIRSRLSKKLRSKFDSADFAQAVWASFFALAPHVKLADRPDAVAAFLARMARNKVIDAVRQRLATARYDVERESSLEELKDPEALELVAADPTPEQIAMAREEWDRLLDDLPALHRQILLLAQQQRTQQEIADSLGLDRGTVRRVFRRLARKSELEGEPEPGSFVPR